MFASRSQTRSVLHYYWWPDISLKRECRFSEVPLYLVSRFFQVLSGDPGEDPQVHACKLLEVVVLQCQGRIDNVSICCVVLCCTCLFQDFAQEEVNPSM